MGIKSHGEEGGLDVVTHEVVNGKRVKLTDSFRHMTAQRIAFVGMVHS